VSERVPPVPPECDLRGLPWMPVDTVRLMDSDINAIASGEEFRAAVRLWCKAWHQVPAASLPDDDRILSTLSGYGARWKKLKAVALRGFVRCSDGRLYHPVIAEKALEAWAHRQAQRARINARWEKHRKNHGDTGVDTAGHTAVLQGTGTGQDKKPVKAGAPADTEFEKLWQAYPKRAGNNPKNKALRAWRARLAEGATPADILAGLERYARFCAATAKTGTEFVMQAATFLGPEQPFAQPWTMPSANGGWDKTDEGTLAKGREVGVATRPGESMVEYRGRIRERLGV
jgi:hypothetical protein